MTTVGVADPDGTIVDPDAVDPNGIPIYTRPTGFSFLLFAEFKKGPNNIPIGEAGTQGQEFPGPEAPDFQGLVDMPLGVPPAWAALRCDDGVPAGEENGGVPVATGFGDINSLKDLACRSAVLDVSGEACTVNGFGNFAFASPQTFKQFCAMIGHESEVPERRHESRMRAANTAGDTGDEGVAIIRVP